MKYLAISFLACGAIGLSLSLSGCGGGGSSSTSDTGDSTTPSGLVASSDSRDLNVTVNAVTINSPPVVEFTITNENGSGVLLDDSNARGVRFALAKLVPGSNGDADNWQSYINRVEQATADVGPGGAAAMPSALQATAESSSSGTLTSLGNGRYQYSFATDITDPAQTEGVTYDGSLTHRLAMQVELEGKDDEIIKNPIFDFVPNGGAVTHTKQVVKIDACNSCHDKLAFHGGGRVDTQYCVTCHNPGTVDANSGNNLDFSQMVHKIHAGEQLSDEYVIWGYRDGKHDYSTVAYPQPLNNCSKCHDGTDPDTPDGDNWNTRPTKEACATCHDAVDFNNHPTSGFEQQDNSQCAVCHVPYSTDSGLRQAVQNAHAMTAQTLAQQFQFNILEVNYDSANRTVTVRFSVTNPNTGSNYNLDTDTAFTAGGGASRMAILIGWDSVDYHNTDSGSVPAQPMSLNPLFGGAQNNGDNTFSMSAQLPEGVSGTGVVGIEGHPALNGIRIPVANVVEYFTISGNMMARREVVSIDKCNDCHENLSLHGNNRQGTVDICLICHNANATDIDVRPALADANDDGVFDDFSATGVDGKREESVHFKTMIHAIHAGEADAHGIRDNGIVVYGFRSSIHDYSHVRYPGNLANCKACHVNDSYALPTPSGSLATTVQTSAASLSGNAATQALASRSDDLNISAGAASCYSCHDTDRAKEHMEVVGNASFSATQDIISSVALENCAGCHGPHEWVAVDKVHALGAEVDD